MEDVCHAARRFLDLADPFTGTAALLGVLAGLAWTVLAIVGLVKSSSGPSGDPGAGPARNRAGTWLSACSVGVVLLSVGLAVTATIRGTARAEQAVPMVLPSMRHELLAAGARELLIQLQGVLVVWLAAAVPGALALAAWGPLRDRSLDRCGTSRDELAGVGP